jgi:two-component system phosphate regulon response regulator PhoB
VTKRILIVDDNDSLRTLLAQAFEQAGFVSIGAESAEAALQVLRLDPPDLCLVDQLMPGMTGAELIRTMRGSDDARVRRMPAIGMTGWDDGARELLAAGAERALRKPCQVEPLLADVRALLAS